MARPVTNRGHSLHVLSVDDVRHGKVIDHLDSMALDSANHPWRPMVGFRPPTLSLRKNGKSSLRAAKETWEVTLGNPNSLSLDPSLVGQRANNGVQHIIVW